MEACKHTATSECTNKCQCTCDSCQEYYEELWDKHTKLYGLCFECGMPNDMTLTSLSNYRDWHFFQPCEACKPAYLALMCEKRLCVACQGPLLPYGLCRGCDCTGDVKECECRQCEALRLSERRDSSQK